MSKRNLLIVGVIVLVTAGVIGGFALTRGSSQEKTVLTPIPTSIPPILLLAQDALLVTLTKGGHPKYVLTIDKIPANVVALSYEITYDTTNKGSQGITTGTPIALKSGQTKYVNSEIVFGSESRGRYSLDQGVNNIVIIIRLTLKDGTEKGWKGTLEI